MGLDIEAGQFKPCKEVKHTHEGSIGNLCNDHITTLMQDIWEGFNFLKVKEAEEKLVHSL